jgi:hypothetical protein
VGKIAEGHLVFEQRSRLCGEYPAQTALSLGAQEPTRCRCAHREQEKSAGTDELAGLTLPEVRRRFSIALPLPVRSPELRLTWSIFRREARGSGPVKAETSDRRCGDALV